MFQDGLYLLILRLPEFQHKNFYQRQEKEDIYLLK